MAHYRQIPSSVYVSSIEEGQTLIDFLVRPITSNSFFPLLPLPLLTYARTALLCNSIYHSYVYISHLKMPPSSTKVLGIITHQQLVGMNIQPRIVKV